MEVNSLLYTEEQEKKILKLREEAQKERTIKKFNQPDNSFKINDPVFVKFNENEISGYIIEKNNLTCIIKTPLGNITTQLNKIRTRFVEDLSHIEIPQKLKTINTHTLLTYLKTARLLGHSHGFSREQIKAELKLRPHITTKNELKKFNKLKHIK